MLSKQISQWLKDYATNAGAEGYVVGLSGGIDSAVAAKLAVDGVGVHNVSIVFLDCGNTYDAYKKAIVVARWLGYESCPHYHLTPHWQLFTNSLMGWAPENATQPPVPVMGNLKARMRMCALYFWANESNRLVLGTSNKTELELGYFTKYGDGGVDVEPLGNLLKREVYDLARELGVPQEIVDAPPTAGLWKGQTDEEELGMTYEEIDKQLSAYYDDGSLYGTRVGELWLGSMHKREMPPIFERVP